MRTTEPAIPHIGLDGLLGGKLRKRPVECCVQTPFEIPLEPESKIALDE